MILQTEITGDKIELDLEKETYLRDLFDCLEDYDIHRNLYINKDGNQAEFLEPEDGSNLSHKITELLSSNVIHEFVDEYRVINPVVIIKNHSVVIDKPMTPISSNSRNFLFEMGLFFNSFQRILINPHLHKKDSFGIYIKSKEV